ncbi:MAG: helix-turn-helix domain-containing protein [Desulfotomaculales bacterium]
MYGQVIKTTRKSKNLTRKELSKLSGVPVRTISAIERSERHGRPETIEKILNALDLKIVICDNSPSRSQQAG